MRLLSNIIRTGIISEVDEKSWRVRVRSGELETGWLRWNTTRAGAFNVWLPPSPGEQVVIACIGGNPESEPILAAAESSFRKWLAEQGLIGQDVALSAIAAALHVHGVQRVEIIEPTQNMAISDIQAARCESFTISEGGRNE
ncbi:phage baseplate assembly protein V [Escherichia coli]|nr:phage baseplate assembly protein V [Escherichia coli]MBI0786492.1 phage baseplate assembly protein V [Escherichia coli]